MNNDMIPGERRQIGGSAIGRGFLRVAHELVIRRAARDANRTGCRFDAEEGPICREHAARIAEAKVALHRDALV